MEERKKEKRGGDVRSHLQTQQCLAPSTTGVDTPAPQKTIRVVTATDPKLNGK